MERYSVKALQLIAATLLYFLKHPNKFHFNNFYGKMCIVKKMCQLAGAYYDAGWRDNETNQQLGLSSTQHCNLRYHDSHIKGIKTDYPTQARSVAHHSIIAVLELIKKEGVYEINTAIFAVVLDLLKNPNKFVGYTSTIDFAIHIAKAKNPNFRGDWTGDIAREFGLDSSKFLEVTNSFCWPEKFRNRFKAIKSEGRPRDVARRRARIVAERYLTYLATGK
jgi:hypothetical protein